MSALQPDAGGQEWGQTPGRAERPIRPAVVAGPSDGARPQPDRGPARDAGGARQPGSVVPNLTAGGPPAVARIVRATPGRAGGADRHVIEEMRR